MGNIKKWDGQLEKTNLEYQCEVVDSTDALNEESEINVPSNSELSEFDLPDKTDYMIAASCGILTGMMDYSG